MTLVEYSDSESEEHHRESSQHAHEEADQSTSPEHNVRKRKLTDTNDSNEDNRKSKPPILPKSLHVLYATAVRNSTKDDPSLHGGRQRQVPHIQGNWPSHVYLDWFPDQRDLSHLEACVEQASHIVETFSINDSKVEIQSFLRSNLGVQLPLHISLSSPLVLTTAVKGEFLERLQTSIGDSGVTRFHVRFTGLDWVANHENSRYFLVLRLARPPHDELNELLRHCNDVCQFFQLPKLYEKDIAIGVRTGQRGIRFKQDERCKSQDRSDMFHISIAWTLQEPSEEAQKATRSLKLGDLDLHSAEIDGVRIKIGNIITKCDLPS